METNAAGDGDDTPAMRADSDTSSSMTSAKSRFDSRQLNTAASADEDRDADVDLSARYLTHQAAASSSSGVTFDEAFAAIKQTASYTAPSSSTSTPAPLPSTSSSSLAANRDAAMVVLVNRRQTGNPLLAAIRNVSLEFRDGLVPDYVVNAHCCVLFLSVRYHLLHADYLMERMTSIQREDVQASSYKTKVVLCLVDVDDNEEALHEINRVTLLSSFTLVLCWSQREAARYLETLKAYENKSAGLIKEKIEGEFVPQVNDVLTTIRSVNKTDVVTLLTTFGSVSRAMNASLEELSLCPGIGATKVRHLLDAFQEPFVRAPPSSTAASVPGSASALASVSVPASSPSLPS